MGKTDFVGGRGEAIAFLRLSRICRDDNVPYFWPHYLGEKCQTFDFLVELVDAGEKTPFFFVQVKSPRKPYTATQSSLLTEAAAAAELGRSPDRTDLHSRGVVPQ